ncbi:TPR Domain containing protein [Tritrichomonas foetus]|uniref:TPR Domain containing protein n=1 Tax=Tritrichomonas foetus TaxID=1144522 RepID=A0A1J4L2C4_9EUKA|nr:TPR Domain containing protein [Tritrichomonas foetus]|eukprot:OHT16108.1 TPR Domain containing protein [Tritrichomonas foetus]
MDCFQERSFYYFRHGLYGHSHQVCEIGIQKKQTNLILYILSGVSVGFMGETEKAFQIIARLQNRTDLILLLNTCKYCIYSRSVNPNKERLKRYINAIIDTMHPYNSLAAYISSLVLWYYQEYDLVYKIRKESPQNTNLDIIHAWIELMDNHPNSALKRFEEILRRPGESNNLFCNYGKAVSYTTLGQYNESLQIYNNILAKYDFPEINIEKCRIFILLQKWDFAIQISEDIRSKFFSPFENDVIRAFHALVRSQSEHIISDLLDEVIENCMKYEQNNWKYQIKLSYAFATLSKHSLVVFDRLIRLATAAYETSNDENTCLSIFGYHQYLANNFVASLNSVNKVLDRDVSNQLASELHIRLMIDTGRAIEAQDTIDMYHDILKPEIIFNTLKAKMKRRIENSNEALLSRILDSLNDFSKNFMKLNSVTAKYFLMETKYESFLEFFICFRADVIIDALDELFTYNYSSVFRFDGDNGKKLAEILKHISAIFPNYLPFNYFQGLFQKRLNKQSEAYSVFERILFSPGIYRLSHCLSEMAELLLFFNKDQIALNCIEEATIEDPTLVNSLKFSIQKARIMKNMNESIPNIIHLFRNKDLPFQFYLDFIDLCLDASQYKIASEFIIESANHIKHPYDKAMLVLRQAYIFAYKKNMTKAFVTLDNLKKHTKYLFDAVKVKADLYLQFLDDKESYISCFYDLVQENQSPEHYILLGDAHFKLKQFNQAIDAYKNALEKDPSNDHILISLALTYVSAHRFEDAVSLFTKNIAIMRVATLSSLKFINLMIQLKKYNEADQCIDKVMRVINSKEPTILAAYYELQGDICTHNKKYREAIKRYNSSFQTLTGILIADIHNSLVTDLKHTVSILSNKIASNYQSLNDIDRAIDYFTKSLEYDETNSTSVVHLFELFKNRYDIEKCMKVCKDYLAIDPQNETVALLLTSTQAYNLSDSIACIRNVLDAHPHFIRSLVRLIEMCARSGRLQLARYYISQAKCNDPGFYFALGLYNQYVGSPEKALKNFKTACGNHKWETPAKIAIFNVLSNPDRKYLWFENDSLAPEDSLTECEKLLNSIEIDEFSLSIMKGSLLCSRNTIDSVSQAEAIYSKLVKENPGNIPASVSSARCKTRLGKFDQAKKILGYVLSRKAFHEEFSYFEEAYLMMAYIVERDTNFNSAQHLILLALELNMCCKKAWEMSAAVHFKNKMYSDAANAYSHLWELCDKSDPEIGYSYAYCSMKAKKYDIALIICRAVLDLHPEYKDLKKEILIPSYRKCKV